MRESEQEVYPAEAGGLGSALPQPYATWLADLLGEPVEPEPAATCHDCVMLPQASAIPPPGAAFFRPATRCCTFLPNLPNFMVGRILRDEGAGRQAVELRIIGGAGSSPLGLLRPPLDDLLYRHGRTHGFGQSQALRCPYLGGGRCLIHPHRAAVCATWFCKHQRGAVAQRCWRGLQDVLERVERALSLWCVLELQPGPELLERLAADPPAEGELTAAELDRITDPEAARRTWGRHLGHEREFYLRCADLAATVDWPHMEQLGGVRLRLAVEQLREAYRRRCAPLPPTGLRPGAYQVRGGDAELVRITTYSAYDPLDLPPTVLAVLPRFDGRPTSEVQVELTSQGLGLSTELLRQLVDFGVLVAEI